MDLTQAGRLDHVLDVVLADAAARQNLDPAGRPGGQRPDQRRPLEGGRLTSAGQDAGDAEVDQGEQGLVGVRVTSKAR